MRATFFTGLLAGIATVVAGQNYVQSDPFHLKLTSTDATLDGQYLHSCHTGASTSALCMRGRGKPDPGDLRATYRWNYTVTGGVPSKTGVLTWSKPFLAPSGALSTASQALTLHNDPASNVAALSFDVRWLTHALFVPDSMCRQPC